jgi:transposase
MDNSLCGRHRRTRSPECRRCKKGEPEKPTDPRDEALGRSRGGFSTKIHVRCEGRGKPVCFALTPGEQHEATVFEQLMEMGSIKRAGRGRPRRLPGRIVADKGYSSKKIRLYLRRKGINYTIPKKSNEKRTGPFNKAIYKQRNRVERLINRLKQARRIATRYEKRAENYRALLTIAAILLWL